METVFLGTIAAATVIMALVQVGLIVYGARLARRVDRLTDVIETELKPTLTRMNEMGADMSRATSLAVAQMERFDQLFGRLAERLDRVTLVTQDALIEPFRHGSALLEGFKVALSILRGSRGKADEESSDTKKNVTDDEKALFIG
tara:strand:+ start:9033 stop:9467 length:435 start_codon:yes stop_codon:yes gene_type:complete